jgi:hypothetical protein
LLLLNMFCLKRTTKIKEKKVNNISGLFMWNVKSETGKWLFLRGFDLGGCMKAVNMRSIVSPVYLVFVFT